jgi:(p)ppGpp synthase/HD superfamily hydrolase
MTTKIDRAREFAHAAHDSISQVRKYSGLPYWTHTDEVADLVAKAGGSTSMVVAAHLHDVLEDVAPIHNLEHPFGMHAITAEFGHDVMLMVFHLTDIFTHSAFPWLNRARRKELERSRLALAPPDVHTIKLADLISNTRDIVTSDPSFAKVYLHEKSLLIPFLDDGNEALFELASRSIL